MNLALDFGATAVQNATAVQTLATRFLEAMQAEESPVRAVRHQPAREARLAEYPDALHADIARAMGERGIEKLYTHQAAAIKESLDGKNVVVVTPTASGKTLCYNLPVVQTLLNDPAARAIYLFPTKALAEDQRLELQRLNDALGGRFVCHSYDGDTPSDARRSIRDKANVILTNPDMLHTGILPHHTKWAKLFEISGIS